MKDYDVIVVGGGAAGMMAAGQAAARGKKVLLLEGNARLGEKLRITGGGRCNITNAEPDEKILLSKFGTSEQALYSAFSQFGTEETFSFFRERALPLVIEANDRAFPRTKKAPDVVRVLEAYLAEKGVEVQTGTSVEKIVATDGTIEQVIAGGNAYRAASYIFATGGLSHPETGSTGDGFGWLRALGHTVANPTPTIVPLATKEPWVKHLAGKSMPDVKITFYAEGSKRFARTGTVLFTHFGISGPTILNAAGKVADLLHEGTVTARIDLHPALDLGILDRNIMTVFDANKNKLLKNVLKELVPPGTSDTVLSLIPALDPETKVHSVRKEERRMLAELLKAIPLTITELMGFERAVVADGGVLLSEIDTRTMRSKKVQNLYIIGDLLHITRPSGGYSLQLCWTTGFVAGSHV
ncbi:MAG: aminoacetone oxidase family FAD-binding enzyme [Parcubacteria group bacterium]|nr:aminoacetone oxidase family FAD-binding enzyme [Parcubacteria group bacterium]